MRNKCLLVKLSVGGILLWQSEQMNTPRFFGILAFSRAVWSCQAAGPNCLVTGFLRTTPPPSLLPLNNSVDLNGSEESLNNYLVISFLVESRENCWKKIGKFFSFLIKPNIILLMPDIKSSKSSQTIDLQRKRFPNLFDKAWKNVGEAPFRWDFFF